MFGLQEATKITRAEYGILETEWVTLRPAQVDAIPIHCWETSSAIHLCEAKNEPVSIYDAEQDASLRVHDYRRLAETHFGVAWGCTRLWHSQRLYVVLAELRENALSLGCSGDGERRSWDGAAGLLRLAAVGQQRHSPRRRLLPLVT